MGNDPYEQFNNVNEFHNGISNLILSIAGNTCHHCHKNFIPNNKNDELCDDCRYKHTIEVCLSCGSSVVYSFEHCCMKCFEKHKRICSRCGDEHILYQNGKCKYCQYYP